MKLFTVAAILSVTLAGSAWAQAYSPPAPATASEAASATMTMESTAVSAAPPARAHVTPTHEYWARKLTGQMRIAGAVGDYCVIGVKQSDGTEKCLCPRSNGAACLAAIDAAEAKTPDRECLLATHDDKTHKLICAVK